MIIVPPKHPSRGSTLDQIQSWINAQIDAYRNDANRKRLQSYSWSLSGHCLVLALLAWFTLSHKHEETFSIVLSASDNAANAELESLVITAAAPELPIQPPLELTPTDTELEMLLTTPVSFSASDTLASSLAEISLDTTEPSDAMAEPPSDAVSISEMDRRVANAGGQLEAPIRISLMFDGRCDLDLHLKYTARHQASDRRLSQVHHIFYGQSRSPHGTLDVDANATHIMPEPCENIVMTSLPYRGNYTVGLHYYRARKCPAATDYTIIVKRGNSTRVYRGTLSPNDGIKTITQFRHSNIH